MCPDPGIREYDHDYPPGEWTVDEVAAALEDGPADATGQLPTYEDAAVWQALKREERTRSLVAAVRDAADRAHEEPPPDPSASRFLAYERDGDREAYQSPYFAFQRRLSALAVAECLDREGRYLDAILDHAWSLCERTTWLLPAHLPDDESHAGLPQPISGQNHRVALFSARTALVMSDLDRLLGERLHPALRERIRLEVDRRVLTPFAATIDDHWGRPPTGNWNAVCNASAAVAALRVETNLDRLARIVTKAIHSLRHYLANFDPDGCTPEGVEYWNFGFGHYLLLDQHLDARTDGALSLLTPPVVRKAARFPLRVELSPGRFVPFSDVPIDMGIAPHAACYAGTTLDRPALSARGLAAAERDTAFRRHADALPELWRTLAWARRADHDRDDATTTPPRSTFFPGHAWWVARAAPSDPKGLVVAAKGGHNGEPHNHNDCGSVVIDYRGESLLADLGAPTYDRDYFGPDRYEYLTARSLGHSVPLVNGCEQAVGEAHAARITDRSATDHGEAVSFDLTGCYPDEAGLDALERTVALDRSAGSVSITDEATVKEGINDPSWQSVFVSYHPIEPTDEGVVVNGDRGDAAITVTADQPGASVDIEFLPDAVDVSDRHGVDTDARDVWRVRIEPPTAARSTVALTVTPGPSE